MSFVGKSILITGASRGLGLATARLLAQQGASITACARDGAALHKAWAGHVNAPLLLAGDVADAAFRDRLIEAALSRTGTLDVLINNAATVGPSPMPEIADYPLESLRSVFETNVLAPLALMQATLPHLRRGGGQIINVTSDAASGGYPGWGGYGASKAALELITHTLGEEIPGVRALAFDPGEMNTQAHQEAEPGVDLSHLPAPDGAAHALVACLARPPEGVWRTGVSEWEGAEHAG